MADIQRISAIQVYNNFLLRSLFYERVLSASVNHDGRDYRALNDSNTAGESTAFVAFMLKIIKDALQWIVDRQHVGINADSIEESMLTLLKRDGKLTAKTLASILSVSCCLRMNSPAHVLYKL